jgi:CRISPR-associated protein (TIGR02584 family)
MPTTKAPIPSGTRTVLVAVTGLASPIFTELLWALADAGDFPDRIVVVSTKEGRKDIVEKLFTPQGPGEQFPGRIVWEVLLEELEGKLRCPVPRSVREWGPEQKSELIVAGATTEDVRDAKRAAAFGNVLFDTIARYKQQGWRVVACMAGGRKQMEYTLYGCMSLLATDGDRLVTVTITPEYWARVVPRFFFPPKAPTRHQKSAPARDPKAASTPTECISDEARVQISDISFPVFSVLVGDPKASLRMARSQFRQAFGGYDPDVTSVESILVDPLGSVLRINQTTIQISPVQMAVYCFLVARTRETPPGNPCGPKDVSDEFDEWLRSDQVRLAGNGAWKKIETEPRVLTRALSEIRSTLEKHHLRSIRNLVVPVRHGTTSMPNAHVVQGLPAEFCEAIKLISPQD